MAHGGHTSGGLPRHEVLPGCICIVMSWVHEACTVLLVAVLLLVLVAVLVLVQPSKAGPLVPSMIAVDSVDACDWRG